MDKRDRSAYIRWLFPAFLFVASIAAMIAYNAYTSDRPQIFTDVIKEATAIQGSNKTAERNLYYIFSVAGAALCLIVYMLYRKKYPIIKTGSADHDWRMPLIAACTYAGLSLFLSGTVDPTTIMALVLGLILVMVDTTLAVDGCAFMFMCIYGICAIYRLYVYCGGQSNISEWQVGFTALTITVVILPFTRKIKDIYARGLMILQLIVPFVLLIFTASSYDYFGSDITIQVTTVIKLVILAFIAAFVIEAVFVIRKNIRARELKLRDVISYGSCIAILSFNSYTGYGAIMGGDDYHHPFENIIGFSQIFELGQKAFDKYIPISGAYSVLSGALLSFFGKGKVTYYNVCQNLFYLGIAVLITVFLRKTLVNREWVLFAALLFKMINYNRVALILPIILILSYQPLIRRKNTWLKVWFISSLIHGLYYPLFGAAVCAGFLPLAIYEFITYIRSEEFKTDTKKVSFYVWWIICLLPAILSLPWLWGTFKHIRALGEQTIYADGLTRFAQFLPDGFLPTVENVSVKTVTFYVISYILPVSIIWICTGISLITGGINREKGHFSVKDPYAFMTGISGAIIMLISFSYTVIRMDIGNYYARSQGVINAVFVLIIVLVDRYVKDTGLRRMFIVYALVLTGVVGKGYTAIDQAAKLNSAYVVQDGYKHVDGYDSRFGECFIYDNDIETEELWAVSQLDKSRSYFAIGDFGYYYLYDIKGDGPMEAVTVKGYNAACETIDNLRKNGTYIGTHLDSIENYYLYNWLVTSGEYIWDEGSGLFVPNTNGASDQDAVTANRQNPVPADSPLLLRTASSWGESIDSLNHRFNNVEVINEIETGEAGAYIDFDEGLYGNDCDFLYIEVANDMNYDYKLFHMTYAISQDVEHNPFFKYIMKKDYNPGENIMVKWTDDKGESHDMTCCLGRGRLLIPLGGGKGWLLNRHEGIEIAMVDDEGNSLPFPGISGVRFLKLKNVQ